MYIYITTNLLNGKFYIGKRVYRKKDDNWYLGSGIYLNRAIKKYGREYFKKEILEWCNNKIHLCEREIYWIKQLNATNKEIGYNLSLGGDGGNVGIEAYIKIGNKLRGKKKPKEFGEKISKALKGKSKSKEHNEKVRQSFSKGWFGLVDFFLFVINIWPFWIILILIIYAWKKYKMKVRRK